jgi:hypothetical protein
MTQIINFASRFASAFGMMPGNISKNLNDKGFGDVIKNELSSSISVYYIDKNSTFDEVSLYNLSNKEFKFGFGSMSNELSTYFATPPLLSLKKAKKLVKTIIDGSNSLVIERFGTEPYSITWRGLLIDMENHDFPLDKLKQLSEIFEANEIWSVSSEILNAVGVESVVIEDVSIDFIEGFQDTISYQFTMTQIEPLEYSLVKK